MGKTPHRIYAEPTKTASGVLQPRRGPFYFDTKTRSFYSTPLPPVYKRDKKTGKRYVARSGQRSKRLSLDDVLKRSVPTKNFRLTGSGEYWFQGHDIGYKIPKGKNVAPPRRLTATADPLRRVMPIRHGGGGGDYGDARVSPKRERYIALILSTNPDYSEFNRTVNRDGSWTATFQNPDNDLSFTVTIK